MQGTTTLFIVVLAGLWGVAHLYYLFNGLASGTMRSFPFGRAPAEASRTDRPARFWVFTAVNGLIVAISVGLIAVLLLGQK
jgi:hypothetical protein